MLTVIRHQTCFIILLLLAFTTSAQYGNPPLPPNPFGTSDSLNAGDSLKTDWVDEQAKIYYQVIHSNQKHQLDTTIYNFHHYQTTQPWWGADLGNEGTAVQNLFFNPSLSIGYRLGYTAYDLYSLRLDSLRFYNTTRPYSSFAFMLGSNEQQNIDFLHTQNITPLWNFAARIRYQSSNGFFAGQKASNISGSFNTGYESKNDRYQLQAAVTFNKFKQDENGGIVNDSLLKLPQYSERDRIPVHIPLGNNNRSAVTNGFKTFDLYLQNNYSWGKADTIYNEDSTKATYRFTPRFRLQHELLVHNETHIYQDKSPDSIRYVFIDPSISFGSQDSVYGKQSLTYFDNKFSLNGFIGKSGHLAQLKAGIANRIDHFNQNIIGRKWNENYVSNYLFGSINKEALLEKQWAYKADAALYFSGPAIGNFSLNLMAGKDFGKWGHLALGLSQNLTESPLAFRSIATNHYQILNDNLEKESITKIWGKLWIPKLKLQLELNNYVMGNYLYFNSNAQINQANALNITQLSGRIPLTYKSFSIDNEVVWQQTTQNSPVRVPAFLFREQFKIETYLFKKALHIATGLEFRYASPYYQNGYLPYFNQFYIQNTETFKNIPEAAAFFNFKVKSFRAFLLVDQIQQLIAPNNIQAIGYYPAPNFNFKFGFNWVLIN